MEKDVPTLKWYQFWQNPPNMVTRITIKEASGIERQDIFGSKYFFTQFSNIFQSFRNVIYDAIYFENALVDVVDIFSNTD